MLKTKLILDYLMANDGVTKEYSLLRFLEKNHPEFFESLGVEPSLYKKHFWLFHHLYHLDVELLKKNVRLIISPLEIRLCEIGEAGAALGEKDALKAFYLDKKNLNLSTEEVINMQKKFWEKFLAIDEKAAAIKTLGLEDCGDLNRDTLKRRFNQLAQKHHPDRGGDSQYFISLRHAYETLKLLVK
ncbi:DNA-J related domain-containing protein [Aliikangiella coralliicola]|uniref:J domain-containing protein n=1 Tax=Aliikangiella coralliicola TaxID=2592383 RepID=A0A545UBJ8_9GAMM|nr:DNA-J related domain-containing protein [Aliikangiella coralliicola]TQV86839.1 hypothetical protein FLL46_13545 [Aliikangiella coralliicola]